MRIKEEFKRLGHFWLPSAPERQIPGTLSISDGGNIELEVTGLFHDGIEALLNSDSAELKRIVGLVEKDGWVTLEDCYYKGPFNFIGSPSKSFIHVGRVFTGVAYHEDDIPLFNTLTFSVEGIDEWVGINGFEAASHLEKEDTKREKDSIAISYQPPTNVSLNLNNGMQLLITFPYAIAAGFAEYRISQKTYFELVSEDECELDEFTSVVHKITTFLCLAVDQTVSVDGMSATSDNRRENIGDGTTKPIPINIYYPSQWYSKDEPRVYQGNMLFEFGWIQDNAERIINNWIKAYEKITPAFNLYFLAKMGAQQYLEDRFLALVQGLEAYHRRTSNEKQMDEAEFEELVKNLIDQCPEEKKEWLRGKLRYGNEVSLRNRIKRMIEPFKDTIGTSKERRELIESIIVTRNYLTHYDLSLESKAVKDEDLWPLCLKVELLFQLQFFQLIGFSREQIDFILTNSNPLK